MLRKFALGVLASTLFAGPASAALITVSVASGGIDVARTCSTVGCGTAIWSLAPSTVWATTGTITIDTTGLTMQIALSVPTFKISGAADNGVTELQLLNTTYTTVVGITVSGPIGGLTTYSINETGQTAAVDPASVVEVGSGSSDPIFAAARITGSCSLFANDTGQCGFTFGAPGLLMPAPLSRYLRQTMNLGVVPEPGTLVLLTAGLAGLAWASRRPQ